MSRASDSSTIDGQSDKQWIDRALDSFASVEPKEKGIDYVRARAAWARKLVSGIAAERVPQLIVALFECYDRRKNDAFSELMWLIEAFYAALPRKLGQQDACAILAATRHSCGHGGVAEPVQLAKAAFDDSAYTAEFFQALRSYRDRLAGLRSNQVTRVRGEIALTLWLDPQESLRPRHCLSAGIRQGYLALADSRRNAWSRLFRHLDRTARRRPDKKWTTAARSALNSLGADRFIEDFAQWFKLPEGKIALSTGGRHVVKTLIWYSALCESNRLDNLIPRLIDLQYAKPKAAVHLIYAVGFWLEGRPAEFADEHRQRLRKKWPLAGNRIRDGINH